jgi:hypothetical protein
MLLSIVPWTGLSVPALAWWVQTDVLPRATCWTDVCSVKRHVLCSSGLPCIKVVGQHTGRAAKSRTMDSIDNPFTVAMSNNRGNVKGRTTSSSGLH